MATVAQARHWLDRWDRQQEQYLADREERFTVIGDVLASAIARPDLMILDLGAGPGSLSARLLDRFPAATVVAIDADPLLLGLAELAYGDRPGLRIVRQDLRSDGWPAALQLDRAPDAIVSTTALHWLTLPELASVYRHCGELLGVGGVFVNGDHFDEEPGRSRLGTVTTAVRQARVGRVGIDAGEDWVQWWQAIAEAPELADFTEGRPAPVSHTVPEVPDLADHSRLLSEARFAEVGTVWQHGDDRVLVGLR
jgi:SAM-dependent methyltransferase